MTRNQFQKRWLSQFAAGISKTNLQKYVVSTGNYIWHIFSWHLLPEGSYLEGDAARLAFDRINSQDALYLEPFQDDCCRLVSTGTIRASDLDKLTEVYIAAPDFSWTYIKTHEGDFCGPYFCLKNL